MQVKQGAAWLAASLLAGALVAAEGPAYLAQQLADTAPNTPKRLSVEKSGGRVSPALFWAPGLARVVCVGGVEGDAKQRHYEFEHFDPATGAWRNAYPPGAPFRNPAGPSDAAQHAIPRGRRMTVVDGQGLARLPQMGMLNHQYAFDAATARLYIQAASETLICDVATSGVTLTGAGRFNQGAAMVWGSFCYDPLNKEVVSVGGTSFEPGGTPGTWLFDTAATNWRKVQVSTPAIAALASQAARVRDNCWALLSACRSRFFVTESADEAGRRLDGAGDMLAREIEALQAAVVSAQLPERLGAGRAQATARLGSARAACAALAPRLAGAMNVALLGELQEAHRLIERACLDLAPEPCGRAHSQMTWDPVSRRIVLFGGDGQDRTYADTWLYDPATRAWEQRYPTPSPAPRSCHILGWLPEAGRVVMIGGYDENDKGLPFEVWTYDVAANRWQCLSSMDRVWDGKDVPTNFKDMRVAGAVVPGDYVLMADKPGNYDGTRRVWALKIDAAQPAAGGTGTGSGGAPARVTYGVGPDAFERAARIDPAGMESFFEQLPANTWVHLPPPPRMAPTRDYGTTRYDPLRRQFLWWGGGHVNYWGCEVSHYSLRSGNWTASSTAENYMEPGGQFSIHVDITFRNAPQIPVHAYQCYDFDAPSGLLVVNTRGRTFLYDTRVRSWNWMTNATAGINAAATRATSEGVIACASDPSGARFYRFDGRARQWNALPLPTGDRPPVVGHGYGDYSGFCPDERRGCLWIFERGGVWRYDLKSGASRKVADKITDLQVKGYLRDMIYIPEIDRVMFENRAQATGDWHSFWNTERLVWERAALKAVKDGKTVQPVFSTGHGFMRDPERKLLFVNGGRHGMYAARLDAAALVYEAVPAQAPPAP